MSPWHSLFDAPLYGLADARAPRALLDGPLASGPGAFARVDLRIENGRIGAIAATGEGMLTVDAPRLSLNGGIILPTFVDAHTHLDKGHIWPRADNPDGTFLTALGNVLRDRGEYWTAKDVAARMDFAIRCGYAHGTAAIRTHIDSVGAQTRISWPVFAEARDRWRGRVDLQASPLFAIDLALDEAHMRDIEANIDAHGSNLLGAATFMIPNLREALDAMFALAQRKGYDLDFHVDETEDVRSNALRAIAETALAHKFEGRVLCGHCCTLSRFDDDERARTIDAVARAGLSIVSLPMCNIYLQDSYDGRTPRWRGVTALHELRAAGVNVMIASDNTRDPFYAYGDLDMMEVWREGARIAHLDRPPGAWTPSIFASPARAMGLAGRGALSAGGPADLVLTRARSFTELFARPQSDRTILRDGRRLDAELPDYSELDALEGFGS